MSGGSLDYAFSKVEDIACAVDNYASSSLHRAFAEHLRKVAKALHDLEWVWSSDYARGDEAEAIEAVVSPADVLLIAKRRAELAMADLQECLAKVPT